MHIKKKSIILSILSAFIIIIFLSFFSKIYFSVKYPEKELGKIISIFFNKSLNRAFKFEEIQISFTGNIIISNFNLSDTSDFNDNISLIKSEKVIISLNFIDLLSGDIAICGLEFYNPDINFLKRYGKKYIDIYKQLIDIKSRIEKIKNIYFDNFSISFINSNLYYKEIFKDENLLIEFNNLNVDLLNKNKFLKYKIDGYIKKFRTKEIDKGYIDLSGEVNYKNKTESTNYVEIENFDLSYLNKFISVNKFADITLKGGGSTNLSLTLASEEMHIKGDIQTNNLYLQSNKQIKYNIISNENINVAIDLDIINNFEKYILKKFILNDEVIDISANLTFDNSENKSFKLDLETNKINLSDLSDFITPINNIRYKGELECKLNVEYDFKDNNAHNPKFKFLIDDFGIIKSIGGVESNIIDKGEIFFNLYGDVFKININGNSDKSDFKWSSNTKIKSWNPFKSESEIQMKSSLIQGSKIFYIIKKTYNWMLDLAYVDKKKGYEEVYFLQKPIAQYLVNNNVNFEYNSEKVLFGKNAKLQDFEFKFEFKRGVFALRNFDVFGYDASYSLDIQAYFHRDYPRVTMNGTVNGFNLEDFFKDYSTKGNITGKAYFNFDYELSAFRIFHILQNAKGNLHFYIRSGSIENTYIQEMLSKFLVNNKYTDINLNKIENFNTSISLAQFGENFYFRNLYFNSDVLNFSSNGKYNYLTGINIPIYIKAKEKNKLKTIPVILDGPFSSPCIDLKKKSNSKKICF